MNIRLLRFCSFPIRISSPELHASKTFILHELHNMERYVTTTYPLHEVHMCIQGGYVTCRNHPKSLSLSLSLSLSELPSPCCGDLLDQR